MRRRRPEIAFAICASLLLAGCTVPRAGGLKGEFLDNSEEAELEVSEITSPPTRVHATAEAPRFREEFTTLRPVDFQTIRRGDRISVTVFESMATSGLHVFDGGRISFDELLVGAEGSVGVPFAGAVPVAGLLPAEIEQEIAARLDDQILNPQVNVRIVDQPRGTVTLLGGQEPSMALSHDAYRLSSAVAAAKIETVDPAGTLVTLRRGETQQSITLEALVANAENDVALRSDDVVTFSTLDRHVVVLGAVGEQQRIQIPSGRYSLLAAIADMQGLDDELADPSAVFLIRTKTGGDTDKPVIVGMDSRDPAHLAAAGDFQLVDGDILFVSNAGFAQAAKVLRPITSGIGLLNAVRP